jgi:multidrug efflux pump subunit AcrA (membrane-fusion protein)
VAAPETAIQIEADQPAVFTIGKRGDKTVAIQRPVVLGDRDGGLVEIRQGLTVGETIVADGVNRVESGRPVKVVGKADKAGKSGRTTAGPAAAKSAP